MTTRTVLFDLDATLCQPCRSPETRVAEAFDRANVEPYCTAADLSAGASEQPPDADSITEYYTLRFEAAAEQAGADPNDAIAVARAYEEIGGYSAVEFLPGAETILQDLDGTYALGLVTNGLKEIQQQKVETLGIGNVFDTLVFSIPENGRKPAPDPFEQALYDLDATPETTVYVGNSRETDVAGANAAGIRSIWIPQEESPEELTDGPKPDHTLDSLHNLKSIL